MADVVGAGAVGQLVDVAIALVGVAVGLARGGLERRAARAFTLWMLFRAAMSVCLYFFALRDPASFGLAFRLWIYTVIGLDFAFAAFLLSFPRARVGGWAMLALLAAGAVYELAYFAEHCLVFCFQPEGLYAGPLGFPEAFSLLYAVAGWVFARDLDDPGVNRRGTVILATGFVLLGGFYSTVGIVDWLRTGYPTAHPGYVDSPWIPLTVSAQCLPALGAVPACVALARRLASPWRWALVVAFLAAGALGVEQNFMGDAAAGLTAAAMVALPLVAATWAFARTPVRAGLVHSDGGALLK